MPAKISVSLLPALATPEQFRSKTAVVIDVLRATTTIVTALAEGASEVIPCLEVEEARTLAAQTRHALLGGERRGLLIDGFDLGNSPAEYTADVVSGKPIVFTTTNGTRAMQYCRHADSVLLGAFVNLSALCEALHSVEEVELLCAGTGGQVTREDVLFAGAVAVELQSATTTPLSLNDQAQIAAAAWQEVRALLSSGTPLAECLRESRGGRNLVRSGQEHDIEIAAAVDRFTCVPELDTNHWSIRRKGARPL
jgi:2-phosphosulfolactate phosphatase